MADEQVTELASGDGWRIYEEKSGKYDGVLTLELHTIYGMVYTRFISRQWIEMGNSILHVYENLKAQGPVEHHLPLKQEDYSTWTLAKFKRLTEHYREAAHMAPTHDGYRAYFTELARIEEAFQRLHPRAYKTWEKQFKESFS